MDTLRYYDGVFCWKKWKLTGFACFFHELFLNSGSCNTGTLQSVQMIKVESVLFFFTE